LYALAIPCGRSVGFHDRPQLFAYIQPTGKGLLWSVGMTAPKHGGSPHIAKYFLFRRKIAGTLTKGPKYLIENVSKIFFI
jgi:hypothetical protein